MGLACSTSTSWVDAGYCVGAAVAIWLVFTSICDDSPSGGFAVFTSSQRFHAMSSCDVYVVASHRCKYAILVCLSHNASAGMTSRRRRDQSLVCLRVCA